MSTQLPSLSFRQFVLLLLVCLLSQAAWAQHDIILRNDGREIQAKVLTVGPDQIRYTRPDTVGTDTLQLATNQVFLLRYANGTRELIQHQAAASPVGLTQAEAIKRGAADARQYFRAPGAFWGTYGATLLSPLAGLVTGIAVGTTRPAPYNLTVPDPSLQQNHDYMRSYRQQAQKKKLGKAAAGFGAGVGTLVIAVAVLLSNSHHW